MHRPIARAELEPVLPGITGKLNSPAGVTGDLQITVAKRLKRSQFAGESWLRRCAHLGSG
jgi:hypothetical protein